LPDRPYGPADALTEVLAGIRLRGAVYCCSELSTPWGLTFRRTPGLAFHVVDRGTAHMHVAGSPDFTALRAGDLVLLPRGHEHTLGDVPRKRGHVVAFTDHPGVTLHHGGEGTSTRLVCGEGHLEGEEAEPLLSQLPAVVHVHADEGDGEWLATTMRFLAAEARSDRPGRHALVRRLVEILVVQAIRSHALRDDAQGQDHGQGRDEGQSQGQNQGWLRGLRDVHVARALSCIHGEPAQDWTVASLSRVAGLGRSSFAARFAELVGESPVEYLTAVRMRHAAGLLRRDPDASIAEAGRRVGYASEAAFSRAFKRVMGEAPRELRRRALQEAQAMEQQAAE